MYGQVFKSDPLSGSARFSGGNFAKKFLWSRFRLSAPAFSIVSIHEYSIIECRKYHKQRNNRLFQCADYENAYLNKLNECIIQNGKQSEK